MGDQGVKGKAEEIKGKVKKNVGDITDNEKMQAEGKAEETKGKARQGVSDVKRKMKKAA